VSWTDLVTQFCLELAFGVLFALAFVPSAPVGRLFYRIMATTAFLPLGAVVVVPFLVGKADNLNDPILWTSGAALVAYPFVSGGVRGWKWKAALAWCLGATTAALAIAVSRAGLATSAGTVALGTLSAMATGAVAGSVSLAMVLGHWYLTIPTLQVSHLRRLNRVTVGSMIVCLVAVASTCWLLSEELGAAESPLLGPFGLFQLGTRLTAGLFLPLLFAWMTAGSLQYQNTRSATGILYASTILVLIGTAVSISLQDSYGFPL
jgi:hypothetical protein